MKKLILTAAVALAISLSACGPKGPTGDTKADAKYLVEQCVKAQKDGKDEAAKELTEEYMNYYKEKGTRKPPNSHSPCSPRWAICPLRIRKPS